jgi:SAM-dependent methyltransferase
MSIPQAAKAVPDFDWLASVYRWLEYLSFGPFLWRCRIHSLAAVAHSKRALVLGDGDGRFTARLLQSSPEIRVTAVDGSRRMIEALMQAAAPNQSRLTPQVADLRVWTPDLRHSGEPPFDLVVSHFFLDCLTKEEVSALAHRIGPALAPDTLWLVSEFSIPPTLFGRLIAAPLVAALYFAFRLLTGLRVQSLPDHATALRNAGWKLQCEKLSLGGLLVSQLWQHFGHPTQSAASPYPPAKPGA